MNKDKEEVYKIVAEAVHEVVIPQFEKIEEKMATKEDIDRLERKLDAQQDRLDRHGKKLEDHEGRITHLEAS